MRDDLLSKAGQHTPLAAAAYFEAAPDAIIVADPDGRIRSANRMAAEIFGYSMDALCELTVDDLVPDDVRPVHASHRAGFHASPRIRQMGDPSARLYGRCADGSRVPVEIALSPITVDGDVTVMAVIRDISARIEAEAQHELVRESLDAIEEGVFMFDPDTLEFRYVNEGGITQVGYEREELEGGMTPLDLKPDFDEPTFRQMLGPVLTDAGHVVSFNTVHRRKDGTTLPVEIKLQYPTTSVADRVVVAIVRDITERRESEDRLRRTEASFRSAFDDAPVAMALTDISDPEQRMILKANRALADLLGYSEDEMVGLLLSDITDIADRAEDAAAARTLLDGDASSYTREKRYLRRDGTAVWGQLTSSLLERDGAPIALAHIVNITRRVEAEHARDRRERTLEALASLRRATLDEQPVTDILAALLDACRRVLDSDHTMIATPNEGGSLFCRAMNSDLMADRSGLLLSEHSISGRAFREQRAFVLDDLGSQPDLPVEDRQRLAGVGPGMVIPLRGAELNEGVLVVARAKGSEPFSPMEIEAANSLAAEAAVTFQLTRARTDKRRLMLIEDRERIARDLHDLVIQRLFATGMRLQAAIGDSGTLEQRASDTVDDLDETIGVIRESIFQLRRTRLSLEQEIRQLVQNRRGVGRDRLELDIEGDLDEVPSAVGEQALAALTEMLSNVSRHARANRTHISVRVADVVTVTVVDDGIGMQSAGNPNGPGQGLRNIRGRAADLGGELSIESSAAGTTASWQAPLR